MIIFHDENMIVTGYQTYPDSSDAPHVVASVTVPQVMKMIGVTSVSELSDIDAAIERAESVTAEKKAAEAAEANRLVAKQNRELALDSLTHDFGDGRVMQTRPVDEPNILRAIEIMESENIDSVGWVMADNKKHDVTIAELQSALKAARLAGLEIWEDYNP